MQLSEIYAQSFPITEEQNRYGGVKMADYFKITTEEYEEQGDIELDDIMDKLPKQLQEAINDDIKDVKFNILLSLLDTETPIEQILSYYLQHMCEVRYGNMFARNGLDIVDIKKQYEIEISDSKSIRVDFYVVIYASCISKGLYFVIECDGHDFHEKTKEQAQRDKERDRELLLKGIIPIHFAGSEIVGDPAKCAHKAFEIIYKWCCELINGSR